ncbi:response regulator transcription factor [Chloroflexota bacterium]
MNKTKGAIQFNEGSDKRIELLASKAARNKTNVAQWSINIAVFLFGLLIIIIILVSLGVDTIIVAALAILGLVAVWFVGWKRGKQLYQHFFIDEMAHLQQEPSEEAVASVAQLTHREIEILHFAAKGYANKRIADKLGISENTVKYYFSNILTKLNANDRTEAVVIAMTNGVIHID